MLGHEVDRLGCHFLSRHHQVAFVFPVFVIHQDHELTLLDSSDGLFDLILFDPPYRWYKARDLLELSTADENYGVLTRFLGHLRDHLAPGGRAMLQFATSGDIDYLYALIDAAGLQKEVVASEDLGSEDLTVTYFVFRLTP